jgi:hypothetical protein
MIAPRREPGYMASNARTWFYETPENNAYWIQERVNSTLWMARLTEVYFVAEQTEAPFRMSAVWHDKPLIIEWEPGKWFRLTTLEAVPSIVRAFSNILQIPVTLTFTDVQGQTITEWHRDGGETRWREIQGNPIYQSPVRLSAQ